MCTQPLVVFWWLLMNYWSYRKNNYIFGILTKFYLKVQRKRQNKKKCWHDSPRHAATYFCLGGQSTEKGHFKIKKGHFSNFAFRGSFAPLPPLACPRCAPFGQKGQGGNCPRCPPAFGVPVTRLTGVKKLDLENPNPLVVKKSDVFTHKLSI